MILGYFKGGVDVVVVCFMFWDELKDKVVGLVFFQSLYGGSFFVVDILWKG